MVRPADPTAWNRLVTRQAGVVHRQQARAHGISDDAMRVAVRRGQWQRLGDGAYLTHGGPVVPLAVIWSGLLRVGRLVVVSHDSALWMHCGGPAPRDVHLGVLDGRSVTPRDGIVVHHLPDLGPHRVEWQTVPPRTRIDHTVLDLLRGLQREDDVVGLVTRVIRHGSTTSARLAACALERPRLRHRNLLQELLLDVAEGAQSPLERRDLRNDRLHGLPRGTRQAGRRRGGRRERLDVVYNGDGLARPVVKELDGRLGHDDTEGSWRDLDRDNAAEARGESHLRYGWRDLVGRPCAVAAQVADVLMRNGWRGRPRRCSPSCAVGT